MTEPQLPPDKPAAGLLRSSLLVGCLTLLSRILGLVRDVAIAALAGATAYADAFFVAFKIPNFLRRLFAEGAFAQAFVPVLSDVRQTRSLEDVRHLIDRVAGLLGSSLIVITVLAVVGAPVVAAVFAPGFIQQQEKYQLTVELIRITFPYLMFISLAGFLGAILNTYQRFAVPAVTPVILNLSLIVAALWGVQFFAEPVFALAWGVFVAGLAQFLFQLPFVARLHLLPRPRVDLADQGVRRILWLMVPALFGVSVSQINLMLDTVLASFLPTGSVSWLYYSDRLVELPLGVFAIAVSTVILPSLSRRFAVDDRDYFSRTLDWAVRLVLLVCLPAAVALFILAEVILITLFQYGALTAHDVSMASISLRAYTLGLLPFILIKVLAPGYFARQDTRTPVKIGIIAMSANMLLNIALVVPLHIYFKLGHAGLALATVLSAALNAGLLWHGLARQQVFVLQPGFYRAIGRYLVAALLMALLLLWWQPPAELWLDWGWQHRVWQLGQLVAAGAGLYLLLLYLMGLRISDLKAVS